MADKAKAVIREKTAMFDGIGNKVPPLVDLAKKIDMNSGSLVAVAGGIFAFFMLIFHGIEIAMTSYTILYPAVASVRAIESKGADDDKHWLCYWMVLGFLDVLETFFGFIFWIIPYWGYIRIGLFVWMISFNGAEQIFNMLKPLLNEHKETIANMTKMFTDKATEMADQAKAEAMAKATDPALMMKAAGMAAQAQEIVSEAK